MAGRKPNPAWMAELSRPVTAEEEAIASAVLPCPDHLSPEAQAVWHKIATRLAAQKQSNPLYVELLEAFCRSYVSWDKCQREVESSDPWCVNSRGDYYAHPAARTALSYLASMERIAAAFGFTPKSSKKLEVIKPDEESEEFDNFANG